jgi:hypothetical protein
MNLSLTKGICILAFVSISVTSKVRWRNSLCFIAKTQHMPFIFGSFLEVQGLGVSTLKLHAAC